MNRQELDTFVERYVSMWHEPDPERRRSIVSALWADDAENFTSTLAVRGIDQVVERVARAHERWVVIGGFVFRSAGDIDSHHHLIKFFWEMLPKAGGPVVGRGLDIFVLREDGRIRSLYQFSEQPAAASATHDGANT